MDDKSKMIPDDICKEYLREIARTLGQDRADASSVYYVKGWYYLNISSRWHDGSIGTGGRHPACLRRSEVLMRIKALKTRPNYNKEAPNEPI